MRIIQVGPYPVSIDCIRGGVESSVYGLAKALTNEHQVYAFDNPRLDGQDYVEKIDNVHVYRYKNNGRHNQDAIRRIQEIVEHICLLKPDVVHVHGTGKFSYLIYRALAKKGIRMMLTVHGLLHVEKWNLLKRKFTLKHLYQFVNQSYYEFKLLNLVPHTIVDTQYVANQIEQCYRKHCFSKLPQMHVIPQGINEKYIELNCSPDSKTILSVGAISKRKGYLYLLQAFDLLCEKMNDVQLVIAGVLAEQSYYQEMQSYIQQSPNKDNIRLLVNISQEEMFSLYTKAQIFALHSQEESQGIALVEAMATGLPIVATRVGGIPYVVEEQKMGLLSGYGDCNSFAKNLMFLLTDSSLYKQLANNAIQESKRYIWTNIAKEVIILYDNISKGS
jgi:glycosyltransferase involved in cell wall biosynthesis